MQALQHARTYITHAAVHMQMCACRAVHMIQHAAALSQNPSTHLKRKRYAAQKQDKNLKITFSFKHTYFCRPAHRMQAPLPQFHKAAHSQNVHGHRQTHNTSRAHGKESPCQRRLQACGATDVTLENSPAKQHLTVLSPFCLETDVYAAVWGHLHPLLDLHRQAACAQPTADAVR